MGALLAFFGIFLLSLLVAVLAALQLGDFFRSTEEFAVVLMAIPIFSFVIMLVFAWAYAEGREARVFHRVAIFLALIAIGIVTVPATLDAVARRSASSSGMGRHDMQIMLELLVPALVAILIQWGLVQRRWLQMRGEDDLSRWPWVTTVVAGLAILNPFGLEAISTALRQSASDRLYDPMAPVLLGGIATLVAMLLIECYIRAWMLRRRRGVAA